MGDGAGAGLGTGTTPLPTGLTCVQSRTPPVAEQCGGLRISPSNAALSCGVSSINSPRRCPKSLDDLSSKSGFSPWRVREARNTLLKLKGCQ